jgi:dTDP-4-dehydrorhamnose 3,5-epimerase
MKIEHLEIPGLLLLEPTRLGDQRGFFSEIYSKRAFADVGVNVEFVQDNQSLSGPAGVVRGLHFQAPPFAQAKLIRVLKGRIFDIVVDIRRSSPNYGQHFSTELSEENWRQLYIPEGFAHGFATLEENTEISYKVTHFYAPEYDSGVLWCDPALGIDWPVTPEAATVSAKDQKLQLFAELQSPFN